MQASKMSTTFSQRNSGAVMKQLLTDPIKDAPVNRNLLVKSRRNESSNIHQILVLAPIPEVATKATESVSGKEGGGNDRNVKGKEVVRGAKGHSLLEGRAPWNGSTLVPARPTPKVKECAQNVKKESAKGLTSPSKLDGRTRAGVPEKPAPVVQKKKEFVGAKVNSPIKKDSTNDSSLDGRPPWNISTRVAPKPVPYFKDGGGVKEVKKLTVKELLSHTDLDCRPPWNSSTRLSPKPLPLPSTKKMEVAGAKKVLQQAPRHRHHNDSSAMEAALRRAQGFGTTPAWRK